MIYPVVLIPDNYTPSSFFLNKFLVVLGIELGTLHVLDKYFTTEKHAQTKITCLPRHFVARSCYIAQAGLELTHGPSMSAS